MIFMTILLVSILGMIAYQDLKQRSVTWILFPIMGILMGLIHFAHSSPKLFFVGSVANILLVSTIITILFMYTKYIAHKQFLNVSMGLGDLLFFYMFALGFPTFTFVYLFVTSILFSLFMHLMIKSIRRTDTIPLAGFMGLFLIGVTVLGFLPNSPSLFLR